MEVDGLVKKLSQLTRFSIHTTPNADHNEEKSWKKATKMVYDFIKKEEKYLCFPSMEPTLPKLHVKNMNSEQVWQQLELQNSLLISDIDRRVQLDDSNLCMTIANLCNKVREEEEEEEHYAQSEDEGVETGDEELEDAKKVREKTSDLEEDELSEDEVPVTQKKGKDELEESELSNEEVDEFDADTFGDIALEDDEDDDEDEDKDKEKKKEKTNTFNVPRQKTFQPTSFDTQFLNLRESEWIADADVIGKDFNDDEDNFDFMKEIGNEESDDDAGKAMYDDFFDPLSTENEAHSPPDPPTEEIPQEENQQATTRFEESLKRGTAVHENLVEEHFVGEKPWMLKGEVQKEQRPENSALEEHLEYNVSIRPKPIITEDTTKNIEKLILGRIRSQAWDDVERRVKPNADPFQFKTKLILDQEKSKKSLATIYEEEFIKNQEDKKGGLATSSSVLLRPDEKMEELPIHKEIKSDMDILFTKLDSLSNYHYTPKYNKPEIRVVTNLPAVTIEESTPTTASDATLLAPQEVVAPLRGELKGEAEKTSTDKKRERRAKKMHQKARAKREDQKLKHQLKKTTKDGLLGADASIKVVQKAFKKGQVRTLEKDPSSTKSSLGFFTQLQNNLSDHSKRNKKRKFEDGDRMDGKRRKQSKELTIAKLLL